MEIDEIHNGKGKTLVVNKFLFECNKTTAQGKKYWRCVNRTCPAKVDTQNGEIVGGVRNEHNHRADVLKLVDKKFNSLLKAKTKANVTAPAKKIYLDARNELLQNHRGLHRNDVVAGVKAPHQKKDVVRNTKKKMLPKEPGSRDEVVLHGSWRETLKHEPFIISDNNDGKRMLLFGTEKFLKAMEKASVVYMDGTFKCVPNIFEQLYTLHVFISGKMVPVVYGLLPDRTVETYVTMFRLIQQYFQQRNIVWDPQLFQLDYEIAAKKAIDQVFGVGKVRGCLFHFSQCIWRKVQEYGLVQEYNNNDEINLLVRRLIALPLVPLRKIDEVWMEIHGEAPDTNAVQLLLDYVVETWIKENAIFKRLLWNHSDNYGPRTTNHVEGWHSAFNKHFNGPHPRFYQFMVVIQGEQDRFEDDVESRRFGHPNPVARKDIRDRNNRIMDLKQQAENNEISWLVFAGSCGYLL